jgi:hypothetical protein
VDSIAILIAFALGFAARQIGLPPLVGYTEIAIFGMGRVGTGAYDFLREHYGDVIIGCDSDPLTVKLRQEAGRNVILGDPTDIDFWERTAPESEDEEKGKIRSDFKKAALSVAPIIGA